MKTSRVFQLFCTGILVGITIHNIIYHLVSSFLVLLFIGVLFLNFYLYYKKYLLYAFIFFFSISIGVFNSHIHITQNISNFSHLKNYDSAKNNLEYRVKQIIKKENEKIQYRAKLLRINDEWFENENIYFYIQTPENISLPENRLLQSNAKLYLTKVGENKSYYNYLLSQKIYFKIYVNSYNQLYNYEQSIFKEKIKNLRKNIIESIHHLYPKQEALFLAGILVGAREELPKELKENFNNSGLTHFIAVSGFNITIIILFLGILISYLPNTLKIITITLGVISFVILVGESAPVIRSAIMGLLGYYILLSGRKAYPFNILLASAIIMCILNPYTLTYDVSFQLSFFAVLGILYCNNFLEKIFYFIPKILAIQEALILTIGAFIFTLPIVIVNFGEMSIISPLANILVSWTIPIAMLSGFISIFVDFVYSEITFIFSYFTWIFLKFDIFIVNTLGSLKISTYTLTLGNYGYIFMLIYYSIILFSILYFQSEQKEQQN